MTKHTDTPWKIGIYKRDDDAALAIWNSTIEEGDIEHPIALLSPLTKVDDRDEANAAYIVKAVNAHEALVEACKASLENHLIGEYESQKQGKPRYCDVLEILRAALKLAQK